MREQKKKFSANQGTFTGAILLAAIGYLYYLLFHFRTTESTIISAVIALLIPLILTPAFYYLAYRWAFPELRQKPLHPWILKIVTSIQLGAAVSVWFVQNKTFPAWLLNFANRFLPLFTGNSPVTDLKRYFALITFLVVTFAFALVAFLLLLFIEKGSKLSPSRSQTILLLSYGFLLLSVTTCVYSTDFLEISVGEESVIWYGGTEDYVNFRIEDETLSFKEDLQQNGGFLYGIGYHKKVTLYLSGTGFYGSVLKLVQTITHISPDRLLKGTRVLCAFLTALILTMISLKLKKQFGLIVSLIFSALSLTTYWLMGPASHLMWFFPILMIPFAISIFLYPWVMAGKQSFKRFLIICTVGYFLVFLRSYVYAPVLVLSGAIPVFFYEINRREHWKTILWRCIQICLVGVLGFVLVMGAHFIQLWFYLGTPSEAADLLITKAIFRSAGGDTNMQTPIQIFTKWMNVPILYLSKHVFAVFPQWKDPLGRFNTLGHLHRMTFGAALYAAALWGVSKWRNSTRWLTKKQQNLLFAITITTLAAMIASWSWFPALGHMSYHYHMNGIMYMIPYGLTAFILLGVLVEYSIQLLLKPR